jgi:shikimate kinase
MKNIVLIGFMGTGKTSTGKVLAQRLGKAFIDMDSRIEEEYGQTIPQMFATKGEAYFRQCEKEMVKKVAARANAVISTGGGTIKDPENVALLKQRGLLVCLTAEPEVILERTERKGERPVLDGADKGDRLLAIEKLLAEREQLYRQADFSIDTTELSPLQVTERIIHTLKSRGELHG